MKQIKQEQNRIAREKIGLIEPYDIKVTNKDPGLNYVYNPEVKTKGDLQERARKENFELSKKILSVKHMDEIERLNYREDEIFDMCYFAGERKTLKKLKEERKKENSNYNMKVFSKQTIGVHGHELPKFADSEFKEYWKYNENWVENPEIQSRTELVEKQKYWKKKEDIKIKDYREEEPEQDVFKKEHVLHEKNSDIILKVNNLNHYKNFDPDNPQPVDVDNIKRNHIYRWTTLVNQFSSQKFKNGRYFDNLQVARNTAGDLMPLYSSFTDDNVFDCPGKDMNSKKKVENKNTGKVKEADGNNLNGVLKDNLYSKFGTKEGAASSGQTPNLNVNSQKDKQKTLTVRSKGF